MNSNSGDIDKLEEIFTFNTDKIEEVKEVYNTPLKDSLKNKEMKKYLMNSEEKNEYSCNSSEKYPNDPKLQKCLLTTLLQRLDQFSPATGKDQGEDDSHYFDNLISSFGKKLDFDQTEKRPNDYEDFTNASTDRESSTTTPLKIIHDNLIINKFDPSIKEVKKKKKGFKKKKKLFTERDCDWKCQHCNNLNFGFRQLCNRCHISRDKPISKHDKQNLRTVYHSNF